MRNQGAWIALLLLAFTLTVNADNISFSTFVSGGDIAGVESGNHQTIAFNFAGNKFVGSVYIGASNNQLYSTDLTGTSVAPFGDPIPGAGGEVVVGASLGQGGFPKGDIYAGSSNNGQIYHFANSGGAPTLFTTVPVGAVRQIFFDPGSSFGGDMIVTTSAGFIWRVNNLGVPSLVKSVGEDTEGVDIATSAWGPFAGDLLVSSEGSSQIRLISPGGVITPVLGPGAFPGAETVSFVPLSLDASDPLQGFYVADFPTDIQFAAASNFTSQGLLGDAIVTSEFDGTPKFAWDVRYDSGTGTFSKTLFTQTGNGITQFEDGIFVTPQRISETSVPEPSSLLLLGAGILGFVGSLRRKFF